MRIILAGAAGYLGQHLLAELAKTGHEILCVYGRTEPHLPPVDGIGAICSFSPSYENSIREFEADTVINTAGVYDRCGTPVYLLTAGNVIFPLNLLNICTTCGLKKWINSCTSLPVYLDTYTMSKHQLADWGKIYTQRHNISFANVLLEHFYGPNEKDVKFISFVIGKLLKNEPLDLTKGNQRRDFVYIDDVTSGYMKILDNHIQGYMDIPLGSGYDPRVKEVVEFLKEETGSSSELRFGAVPLRKNEPMTSVADLTIVESFGYKPTYNWKQGMKKTIEEVKNK